MSTDSFTDAPTPQEAVDKKAFEYLTLGQHIRVYRSVTEWGKYCRLPQNDYGLTVTNWLSKGSGCCRITQKAESAVKAANEKYDADLAKYTTDKKKWEKKKENLKPGSQEPPKPQEPKKDIPDKEKVAKEMYRGDQPDPMGYYALLKVPGYYVSAFSSSNDFDKGVELALEAYDKNNLPKEADINKAKEESIKIKEASFSGAALPAVVDLHASHAMP